MVSMFSLKSKYFVLCIWLFCSLGFPHHYRRQNGSSGKRVQPILPGVDGASMPLQIQVRLTCKGTGTATRRATTKRASTQDVFSGLLLILLLVVCNAVKMSLMNPYSKGYSETLEKDIMTEVCAADGARGLPRTS